MQGKKCSVYTSLWGTWAGCGIKVDGELLKVFICEQKASSLALRWLIFTVSLTGFKISEETCFFPRGLPLKVGGTVS